MHRSVSPRKTMRSGVLQYLCLCIQINVCMGLGTKPQQKRFHSKLKTPSPRQWPTYALAVLVWNELCHGIMFATSTAQIHAVHTNGQCTKSDDKSKRQGMISLKVVI